MLVEERRLLEVQELVAVVRRSELEALAANVLLVLEAVVHTLVVERLVAKVLVVPVAAVPRPEFKALAAEVLMVPLARMVVMIVTRKVEVMRVQDLGG